MPNNAQHTTIQLDTALIQEWKQSGDYNYFDEKIQKDSVDSIESYDYQYIPPAKSIPISISPQVVFFIGIILFLLLFYFAMKHKWFSGFFMKEKSKNVEKKKTDEESETNEEEELKEELFRLDLPKLISDALAEKKFDIALKYTYMQAFRRLCEAELLTWRKDATPSEYTALDTGVASEPFRRITAAYVRAQYGHYEVTEDNYAAAKADFEELNNHVNAITAERRRKAQEEAEEAERTAREKGGEA